MKAKSEKRLLAEHLRLQEGLSYNEISEQIGVSKSTVSNWLKYINLTPEQEKRIQQRIENNQSVFVAHARQVNQERFRQARKSLFKEGLILFRIFLMIMLFMSLLLPCYTLVKVIRLVIVFRLPVQIR